MLEYKSQGHIFKFEKLINHLVLFISILLPRFRVGSSVPCDIGAPGGQAHRVVSSTANTQSQGHKERDQLQAINQVVRFSLKMAVK